MNCGFEDCLILDEMLETYKNDLSRVFPVFNEQRSKDVQVICDLAMYNYIEMRHLVNDLGFLIRKKLDGWLNKLLPGSWIPLYSMVTFTRIPYSKVIEKRQRQDSLLKRAFYFLAMSVAVLSSSFMVRSFVKLNYCDTS